MSAEPYIPFDSSFACDNIARRTVRNLGLEKAKKAAIRVQSALLPVAKQIINSGKVKRGTIRLLGNRLANTLEKDPSTVWVESIHMTRSRLSTSEHHRVAYVMAMGDSEREDWLDFLGCEVFMTRKEAELSTTGLDFRIHRHALSRFMQRERRSAADLVAEMGQALQAATFMGPMALVSHTSQHLAIPIGDGLLFGRFTGVNSMTSPAYMLRARFEPQREPFDWQDVREDHLVKGARTHVEIMTYVDAASLTPSRTELRDVLRDFRERHANALRWMFHSAYFPNAKLPRQMIANTNKEIREATTEIKAIIRGPEWNRFVGSVGRRG
jgi:hypothetical protein